LALAAPLGAHADSGVGVDLWIANKLDPNAGARLAPKDARGTSWLKPGESRTPTGFLYMCPADAPEILAGGDWQTHGWLELGYLGASGDTHNAIWQRYSDWSDHGAAIGLFDFHAQRPSDGSYIDIRGSYLSEHNNYLKGVVGRAGSYKVEAFTRSTPNVVSGNARSIWDGVGTNNLTLVDGLTPGASTPAPVAAISAATPERTLQVNRDKQGLGFSYFFNRRWTGYANVTNETREGARPFGGPFFFNYPFPDNGGVYETPRPINDSTINTNIGLRFAGNTWRTDIGYSGSFYRSAHTGFSYEVPFALWNVIGGPPSASAQLTSGQFSSEPDNNYHNLRATLTRTLPLNGQFSLTASAATMRQNDDLLAPINCTGTFGIDLVGNGQVGPNNPFLYSCANWNTTDALSRKTADMRIDTNLFDARIVLQPAQAMTLRGGLRFYREDYRNTYLAFNPLTGEYGYVAENGSQGSVVPGEVGIWNPVTGASIVTRVLSLPLDTQTTEANAGFDWRLSSANTLGATLIFTRNEPEHRERTRIDDTSVKLNWANRSLDGLTLRANYVHLRRDGDRYNYDPYEFTFSESLPGFVEPVGGIPAHTVDALRKYDMASRDQNKIDLMATIMPRDDMTLSASLRGDWNHYDAELGRQKLDTMGVTLQWEWQPSPLTNASVFIGFDRSKLGIANVNEASLGSDPSLGGSTYPLAGRWWVDDTQRNRSLGAHFAHNFDKLRFDASWNWNFTRGTTDYRYASDIALAWPNQATPSGNGGFPDMKYRVNSLTVGLTLPIRERISLRLFDYYERGRISDWHYLGFDQGQVIDHRVYTDGGPEDYNANLIGVMLTVKL
jgi:hypothetical protein